MQGFGGLVLAVSCLFPAIDGCGSPYVPVKEILEEIARTPTSFEDWMFIGWIGFPYLVGLAVCGIVIRWRSRPQQPIQCMGGSVVWLQIAWTAMVIAGIALALLDESWSIFEDPTVTIHAVVAVCSIVCVAAAHRNPLAGRLCVRWFAGLCCLIWFTGWFVEETASGSSTYYGLWLSMAGSMLIIAGAFQEAKLVSVTTPMETLLGLLTCRLRVVDPEEPRCAACGYLLQGLPTNRCPECGTPFESGSGDPMKERVPGADDVSR